MKMPGLANPSLMTTRIGRPARLGVAILSLLTTALHATEPVDVTTLSADQMLDACVASMPTAPLSIHGEMIVRKRRGVELRRVALYIDLQWGATPPEATYTLHHEPSKQTEQIQVKRIASNAPPQVTYTLNGTLQPLPKDVALASTDISWTDLAFDFLWWRGATKAGHDTFKGRACTILEIPQPKDHPGPYAKVRVWMDDAMLAMVKAEGYDPKGERLRSLWVSGLKEVDDRWMISEMEVQQRPFRHRTKVRIQEVTERHP